MVNHEAIEMNMKHVDYIRNIIATGHIDHGKSTLADCLIATNQIISKGLAGKIRYMDSRVDEQDKGITMKSSSISILYPYQGDIKNLQKMQKVKDEDMLHVITLLDSPGHIDFSSEVSTAARLADGAMIVVDAVEGVATQTRSVLYQTYKEQISPILIINKLDHLIQLKGNSFDCFKQIENIISQINALMASYYVNQQIQLDEDLDVDSDQFFSPSKGNVVFASAYHGWGFRISDFSKIFSKAFGMSQEVLNQTLWGHYYFDAKKKKIKKKPSKVASDPMFITFIMNTIFDIYNAVNNIDTGKLAKIEKTLKIEIPKTINFEEMKSIEIFSLIMKKWLPISRSVLDTVLEWLPSPPVAQRRRITSLFPELENIQVSKGELGKKASSELKSHRRKLKKRLLSCSPVDEKLVFVSKMIMLNDLPSVYLAKRRFARLKEQNDVVEEEGEDGDEGDSNNQTMDNMIGFARVFCGTLRVGEKIEVLEPRYSSYHPNQHRTTVTIDGLFLMMGKDTIPVNEVPAGNICGIGGLGGTVFKTATLSSSIYSPVCSSMYFHAYPILKIAVEPKLISDMAQLVKGLQLLNNADPSVEIYMEETGEQVIVTAGEVHAERCIRDLQKEFAKVPMVVSDPIVSFRETIVEDEKVKNGSSQVFTPDKSISIVVRAVPLPKNISQFILEHEESLRKCMEIDFDEEELKENGIPVLNLLKDEFKKAKWEHEWENLWSLGPKNIGSNILLNHIPWFKTPDFTNLETHLLSSLERKSKQELDLGDNVLIANLVSNYDRIIAGFQNCTAKGPLCREPMSGVCFIIEDFTMTEERDISNYGTVGGQIMSAVNRACVNAFDQSARRLVEPYYYCELIMNPKYIGPACNVLKSRRSRIEDQDVDENTGHYVVKCYLPIAESIGFCDEIRNSTCGDCTPNLMFSHWEILDVDPYHRNTTLEEIEDFGSHEDSAPNLAKEYINKIRGRKGLMVEKKLIDEGEKNRTLSKKK